MNSWKIIVCNNGDGTEAIGYKMDMAIRDDAKKPTTFQFPLPVRDALDDARIDLSLDGKKKWAVLTAAALLFLDRTDDERQVYVQAALAADRGSDAFTALIARARSGELRREAEQQGGADRGRGGDQKGPTKAKGGGR